MEDLFIFLLFISIILLIVGLVKPTFFSALTKGKATRKKVGSILGTTTIIFLVSFGLTTEIDDQEIDTQTVVEQNNTASGEESNDQLPNEEQEEVQEIESEDSLEKQEEVVPQAETDTEDESAQTPDNQTNNQSTSPESNETVSQRNAVRSARSYLDYTAFSRDGLIEQLEYEQFSHYDAVYGADNSGADWYEQAAKSAEQYMEYSAFSRGGLIDQLKYEGYTETQAEYGADAVGL